MTARNRKKFVLGVDPGKEGAFALLCSTHTRLVKVWDMPGSKRDRSGGECTGDAFTLGVAGILGEVDGISEGSLEFIIESPVCSPVQGVGVAMRSGIHYGILRALLTTTNRIWEGFEVAPRTWKSALNLTKDKESSRALAIHFFEDALGVFSRKMDHDRCEAALLAYYSLALREDGDECIKALRGLDLRGSKRTVAESVIL